jgi:hypothetical protein
VRTVFYRKYATLCGVACRSVVKRHSEILRRLVYCWDISKFELVVLTS